MRPSSARSSTPALSSAATSPCTDFTSRPTRRAISRIARGPAPAIARVSSHRFGVMTFHISSTLAKAMTAGVIGNVLEWYDFGVYGYLVPTISALFFPGGDPLVSLLSTFAVFGVGFVMRPVGSIVFGIYGDKHGRRKALSAVIFVMAIATFAMGLLPTYAQAGVLAPALLVVVRLFQGLSVGGEFGGSTAYIVEFAPSDRRGFFGSFQLVGVAGGFLLGSLTAALFIRSLSDADRPAWGWRVPFLLGIAVGIVGW